jgi:uncharacterized radical SAM superfamily protein
MNEEQLRAALEKGLPRSNPGTVRFYTPGFMYYKVGDYRSTPDKFPTISITAKQCTLNCKHCNAIVLETMLPATTPGTLFELCANLRKNHADGCLISGGCALDGSVPIEEFTDAIRRIKKELGMTIFVHTGIITRKAADSLRRAHVDAALIDVIGSDETIKEICKADMTIQDYEDSLKALEESNLPFVPHIIAGIHYGQLKGERYALQMIAQHNPAALVVIAFTPINGSEMANITPSKPLEISRVIAAARVCLPRTPLVLGCMRPKGEHRTITDVLALKAGADAIAFPAQEAIDYARQEKREIVFSPLCCAQIYADMKVPAT